MDYNKLAQMLFPDVKNSPEYYEEKFPYRKLPAKAQVTRMAPSPTGFPSWPLSTSSSTLS